MSSSSPPLVTAGERLARLPHLRLLTCCSHVGSNTILLPPRPPATATTASSANTAAADEKDEGRVGWLSALSSSSSSKPYAGGGVGAGTYGDPRTGCVYAATVGVVKYVKNGVEVDEEDLMMEGEGGGWADKEIRVCRQLSEGPRVGIVPTMLCTVTAQVTRTSQRRADCNILCVEDRPLSVPFKAHLRLQDIRPYNAQKVEVIANYHRGDIIRAKVISLGDSRSTFLLSTADSNLGVLFAETAAGDPLQAVSNGFMLCSKTNRLERR
eukprot:GHVS01061274.1.p1 GENE.GHVS01061274.1~~GHVS01061274.1.p1  ORF type:complete len:268 (+),score=58.79 GHVS01061274.1:235-1038(+)